MADTFNMTSENNAQVEQGATYISTITWRNPPAPDGDGLPVDLTGYTARMQMRRNVNSTEALIEMTDANGRLVFDADRTTGKLQMVLSAADTAALSAPNAVYDLELISAGGVVTRLLEGAVAISKEVTR